MKKEPVKIKQKLSFQPDSYNPNINIIDKLYLVLLQLCNNSQPTAFINGVYTGVDISEFDKLTEDQQKTWLQSYWLEQINANETIKDMDKTQKLYGQFALSKTEDEFWESLRLLVDHLDEHNLELKEDIVGVIPNQ